PEANFVCRLEPPIWFTRFGHAVFALDRRQPPRLPAPPPPAKIAKKDRMRDHQEPIFDVAQLAHVELLTPTPERTLWFFKDLLGMQETARAQQSVYLRGYEESYHHSLKITEAAAPGLAHVAWRSSSPQALDRRVAAIAESGYGSGWVEGELGHPPA